jgi:predicted amidophosphoribosyltransferase
VRDTGSQASLHRNERLKNLSKAFAMRRPRFGKAPDVKGAKVLLVDDVLTTGATTHECARVLRKDGGVEKVVVITVARG